MIVLSLIAHILVLMFVWVGFSVPNPRESVRFYYTGPSWPAQEQEVRAPAAADKALERAVADPYPGAYFTGWLGMRDIDQPHKAR
ncbi:MAG: hypothetical protein HYZ86_02340 [Candidatus Omnitrophica bacterium]|nr:hypothetical protein [Candidatus Omnitrophota bacterium]